MHQQRSCKSFQKIQGFVVDTKLLIVFAVLVYNNGFVNNKGAFWYSHYARAIFPWKGEKLNFWNHKRMQCIDAFVFASVWKLSWLLKQLNCIFSCMQHEANLFDQPGLGNYDFLCTHATRQLSSFEIHLSISAWKHEQQQRMILHCEIQVETPIQNL